MKKTLWIVLVIVWSCGSEEKKTMTFYENGFLKSTTEFNEKDDSTFVKNFHKNGNIKDLLSLSNKNNSGYIISYDTTGAVESKKSIMNGKKDGTSIFFENGKIVEKVSYKQDLLGGDAIVYYESGKIKEKTKFQILGDTIQQWQEYQRFSEEGKILENTKRVINNIPDTVDANKSIRICFTLGRRKFNKIRLIIGNFNPNFKLIDSLNLKQIESRNEVCDLIEFRKKGNAIIRAIIFDYSTEKPKESNELKREVGKLEYFEKKVHVR